MNMEKKLYKIPLVEVEKINLSNSLLTGSPVDPHPVPPIGPAPSRGEIIP